MSKAKFKVGDKVKIIKKAESKKDWNDSWVAPMDKFVGEIGEITQMYFSDMNKAKVIFEVKGLKESWNFPLFVLKKVVVKKSKKSS